MSLSSAETYARRAKNSSTASDVGVNVKKAIDELISEIRRLEQRVAALETERLYR